MKDIDQHLNWSNGPEFRDFKQNKTEQNKWKEKGSGHWNTFLRVALLSFSSDPNLVGHRDFVFEKVFDSSCDYLLDKLDCIEMHLICYIQYL